MRGKAEMKKIQTTVLALVAVLAFSALATASASAAPRWLVGGSEVLLHVAASKWAKLVLVHTGGLVGAVTVECSSEFTGTVAALGEDEVASVLDLAGKTTIECNVTTGVPLCSAGSKASVKAVHLPWKTNLLEPKPGEIRDDFLNSGAGEPGFNIICNNIGITCEGKSSSIFLRNEGGEALFEFEAKSEKSKECSDGGSAAILGKYMSSAGMMTLAVS
jgi:hypothetical protein